jgi:hypothetical protein
MDAIVACLFLLDSMPLPCNRRHGSITGIKRFSFAVFLVMTYAYNFKLATQQDVLMLMVGCGFTNLKWASLNLLFQNE